MLVRQETPYHWEDHPVLMIVVVCCVRSSMDGSDVWLVSMFVEIARAAAEMAAETRSARMLRELRTLERAMRPWHDAPVGRDLAEILAPVT
ncbi:hypothetical protein [Streptomyces sp. NPDC055005]